MDDIKAGADGAIALTANKVQAVTGPESAIQILTIRATK